MALTGKDMGNYPLLVKWEHGVFLLLLKLRTKYVHLKENEKYIHLKENEKVKSVQSTETKL